MIWNWGWINIELDGWIGGEAGSITIMMAGYTSSYSIYNDLSSKVH